MARGLGGRPQIQIDKDEFEKLCGIQCTLAEISAWFKCSEDTIERWAKRTYKLGFAEVYAQKRSTGAISLRRMQWKAAQGGNTALLIFLGKQYLGQSDKVEQKQEITQTNIIYESEWGNIDPSTEG